MKFGLARWWPHPEEYFQCLTPYYSESRQEIVAWKDRFFPEAVVHTYRSKLTRIPLYEEGEEPMP